MARGGMKRWTDKGIPPLQSATRKRLTLAASLPLLGLLSFIAWKSWRVAWELLDPPFYQVQSLERVEATYAELAAGNSDDPGGTWHSQEAAGLQLWTLRRKNPARGCLLLLHGFGDDRWGTSPALRWFPSMDASIFTYLRRDDALRQAAGRSRKPYVTFGALESRNVVDIVRHMEQQGMDRKKIVIVGRSLGASVGLLALAELEKEGPLGGFIWEGAPKSSRSFAENLVRGKKDRFWHILAPMIGEIASRHAAWLGGYDRNATDVKKALLGKTLRTPSLCFLATQDRLAPSSVQEWCAGRFQTIQVIRVDTWHLNCAAALGPAFGQAIAQSTSTWLGKSSQ